MQVPYFEEESNKALFSFIKYKITRGKTSVQDVQKRATYSVMQHVCQINTPENLNPICKLYMGFHSLFQTTCSNAVRAQQNNV